MLAQVGRGSLVTVLDAPGLRGERPLNLGVVGDALSAIKEARGTTRHKLAKCGRHPKKSPVLVQVGRRSLDRIPEDVCTELRRRSGATGARWVPRTAGRVLRTGGEVRGRRRRGGSRSGGVPRGTRMQSGVAQRRVHGPLTDLSFLAGPESTSTKFSTYSSQSKRDRRKT